MIPIDLKTYESHGFIVPEVLEEHFQFGDAKLGDFPINESGDWTEWLPTPENQDVAMEPMACVSFATLNALETMLRQRYGTTLNYSDRFLAYTSGTTKFGNDPHTVAEALRKKGNVYEADYPYTSDINTWEKFYEKPARWLYTKALEFIVEYSFGHSWVTNPTQERMMDALKYSPLAAGVYSWQLGENGCYIRPSGAPSNHCVMIYGYVRNQYWLCFDSYSQNVKKLAWDFGFEAVKRFTLDRQIVQTTEGEGAWGQFKKWFQQVIDAIRYGSFGGVARSPAWGRVRKDFITRNPECAVCSTAKKCEVHHQKPFHLEPARELSEDNLITLCRDHHRWYGHLGSWISWNENVVIDSRVWRDKIRNRP